MPFFSANLRRASRPFVQNRQIKYLAIFLLAASQVGPVATARAADRVVSKAVWLDGMKTALPNAFCGETQYFRKCFKVTEDQCIQEAVRATKVCEISIADDLPDELHQPVDGTTWGRKLGLCAGQAYETSLIKTWIESDECAHLATGQ